MEIMNKDQWYKLSHSQREKIAFKELMTSAIIGSVEIVDCIENHPSIWAQHKATVERKIKGAKVEVEVPVYNWVIANPILFDKPIENVRGKLSFWDYELPEEYKLETERKLKP